MLSCWKNACKLKMPLFVLFLLLIAQGAETVCFLGFYYLKVLRCYDNRFRPTERNSEVYVDRKCERTVGGDVPEVFKLKSSFLDLERGNVTNTWKNDPAARELQVIAVPYKEGSHVATTLTDFIPIIQQLQALHENGYVHGDIRAFNVVFGGEAAGLIDFDLSRRPGKPYPQGYRPFLSDGYRIGRGDAASCHNKLHFWHDWFALGNLIFRIHEIKPPSNASNEGTHFFHHWAQMLLYWTGIAEFSLLRAERFWTSISETPNQEKINELILLLKNLEQAGFSVEPNPMFRIDLDELQMCDKMRNATKIGATGSPPKGPK